MAIGIPFLSIGPRVRKRGDDLLISTSWVGGALTLGTWLRHVTVDTQLKVVQLHDRYLWLIARQRKIPFAHIRAVTYGYVDESFGANFSYAHDTWDTFTVGFRLHDDDELHLFSFHGEGTFQNDGPFPDWCYWGEMLLDFSGTQEKRSRALVNVLSKLLKVTVMPPRY